MDPWIYHIYITMKYVDKVKTCIFLSLSFSPFPFHNAYLLFILYFKVLDS